MIDVMWSLHIMEALKNHSFSGGMIKHQARLKLRFTRFGPTTLAVAFAAQSDVTVGNHRIQSRCSFVSQLRKDPLLCTVGF